MDYILLSVVESIILLFYNAHERIHGTTMYELNPLGYTVVNIRNIGLLVDSVVMVNPQRANITASGWLVGGRMDRNSVLVG